MNELESLRTVYLLHTIIQLDFKLCIHILFINRIMRNASGYRNSMAKMLHCIMLLKTPKVLSKNCKIPIDFSHILFIFLSFSPSFPHRRILKEALLHGQTFKNRVRPWGILRRPIGMALFRYVFLISDWCFPFSSRLHRCSFFETRCFSLFDCLFKKHLHLSCQNRPVKLPVIWIFRRLTQMELNKDKILSE